MRSAGFPVLYVYDGGGDLRSIGVWLRPRLGRQDGGPLAARCGGLDRRGAPCMYMYHQFDQWFAALGIFMSSGCMWDGRVRECHQGGELHLLEASICKSVIHIPSVPEVTLQRPPPATSTRKELSIPTATLNWAKPSSSLLPGSLRVVMHNGQLMAVLDIQVYLGGARYGMQLVGLLCLTSLQRLAGMHRPAPLGPAFWAF